MARMAATAAPGVTADMVATAQMVATVVTVERAAPAAARSKFSRAALFQSAIRPSGRMAATPPRASRAESPATTDRSIKTTDATKGALTAQAEARGRSFTAAAVEM